MAKYKCEECGELHEHKKFVFGSPVDYDCKAKPENDHMTGADPQGVEE